MSPDPGAPQTQPPIHDSVIECIETADASGFDRLALEVFAHQFEHNQPYRRFCLTRERTPANVGDWREIPAMPIAGFKQLDLSCGPPEKVFLSTGTSAGVDRRSRHLLPDLRLYRTAARCGLKALLFPDQERLRILSLVHSPAVLPDSSLAQMVSWAIEDFGSQSSAYAIDAQRIDFEAVVSTLQEAERSGELVCLMTTTGALIRLLDALSEKRLSFRLPHGSRLMDTGGDKGAPRHLSRNGLLHAVWNSFAIPGYFAVNEYGMAELSSQFYDNVIRDRRNGMHGPRKKVAPPWVRTRVLDPASLAPVRTGERGILCHYDLANAGSVMAVLTEDIGVETEGGFQLAGRATGAELRGCSLALSEWATQQREHAGN